MMDVENGESSGEKEKDRMTTKEEPMEAEPTKEKTQNKNLKDGTLVQFPAIAQTQHRGDLRAKQKPRILITIQGMTEATLSRSHKEIRPSFESKVVLASNLVLMFQNQKASK